MWNPKPHQVLRLISIPGFCDLSAANNYFLSQHTPLFCSLRAVLLPWWVVIFVSSEEWPPQFILVLVHFGHHHVNAPGRPWTRKDQEQVQQRDVQGTAGLPSPAQVSWTPLAYRLWVITDEWQEINNTEPWGNLLHSRSYLIEYTYSSFSSEKLHISPRYYLAI